jgi:hypothetical protein
MDLEKTIYESEVDYEATREATEALIEKLVNMDLSVPAVVSGVLTTAMLQLVATSPNQTITLGIISSCLNHACQELSTVEDPRATGDWAREYDELH